MTTAGPLDVRELGVVLPHEHLLVNTIRENRRTGLLNDVELISAEIALAGLGAGGTIVDVTPAELAQGTVPDPLGMFADGPRRRAGGTDTAGTRPVTNVLALRDIAEHTGVNLVLGTGHYREPYLDRAWFDHMSADDIAALMVRDLTEGFPGTGVRAGIIGEIGTEHWYVSAAEERSLRAAARAGRSTGAAVTTHAFRWPVGITQLDILGAEGLPAERVIIGHCDSVPVPAYHAEIAARGAYVQFDTFHRCTDEREAARRVGYITALAGAGALDRILVSHDVFLTEHLFANGGPGLGFVPQRLPDLLVAAGLTAAQVDRILVTNPTRALTG
ncbi:MAG TPA: hypothetical protein VEO01_07970 [Pseudonocardiaceae bacterium]|nr:hypothetical protein [Pseudonocardiaceae bacterium]